MKRVIWIPENTKEFSLFKLITQENVWLANSIKKFINLEKDDLVLDIGGRDGNVSYQIQDPKCIDIVDPDSTFKFIKKPRNFYNKKIQDVQFPEDTKYKLIICCHVLGHLHLQKKQEEVIDGLMNLLCEGGCLVLFHNTNTGYVGSLIEYSRHVLPNIFHDYFNEKILEKYKNPNYELKFLETSFQITHKTFNALAACCWFLFGMIGPNDKEGTNRFLLKLKNDLLEPSFPVEERMTIIKKLPKKYVLPSLLD